MAIIHISTFTEFIKTFVFLLNNYKPKHFIQKLTWFDNANPNKQKYEN